MAMARRSFPGLDSYPLAVVLCHVARRGRGPAAVGGLGAFPPETRLRQDPCERRGDG